MSQPRQRPQPPVVGYTPAQLEAAATPLEAAVVAALFAAAAAAATKLVTVPAGAPAKAVGAAYVTLDDLAAITTMWLQHTDRELMPILRSVFHDTAEHVHGQISKMLTGLAELPPGVTEIPSEVAPIPDVHAEDLLMDARNRLVGIGDLLWANAREQMAQGMREGESIPQLADRVRSAVGVSEPRATMIARTEIVSVSNGASIAQARTAAIPLEKEWMATEDSRTRLTHAQADGQRVPLDQPFIVGGFPLDVPGDPTGPPGEIVNCRCSLGFHLASDIVTAAARKLEGEALAEFNRKHPRGHGGKFGSGTGGVATAVKKAAKAVAAAPTGADVAKARDRLAKAEKLFGSDRSKWKQRDRVSAEKLDQIIQEAEAPKPSAPAAKAVAKPKKATEPIKPAMPKALDPSDRKSVPALRAAYTGQFGDFHTGKVRAARTDSGAVRVTGDIFLERKKVGEFTRYIRKEPDGSLVVTHDLLQLSDPDLQGQGFAEAFNSHMIDWYRANGVQRIELTANIDVGGYAWARAGYDWADKQAAAAIIGRVKAVAEQDRSGGFFRPQFENIPAERLAEQTTLAKDLLKRFQATEFGADDYPTPFEVSQLGRWKGAGRDDWWAGKAILLDSEWKAVRVL